jgi:hypothetical protein
MALRLKDLVILDIAQPADRAIDRRHEGRIGQGAGAGLKGAREEVVEGLIAREIGILGFAHIHAVSGDEPADQRSRRPTAPRIRNAPRKPGQPLFGKEMLGQDEKTITHGLFNAKPGMMCRSVCCGWLRGN